ncbi:histone-like nucleoid-structuring protein Lsr2 [Streptomyces virginiae]|uniref:Lsr2 dimerization domain-containing protein n=1 Tax=Streptomyces virginiae TaxID=1961 RepID=UPI0036CA7F11
MNFENCWNDQGEAVAKRVIIESDLSGDPDAETISFGWDGKRYAVDLTEEERVEFARALKPYLDVAEEINSGQGVIPVQSPGPDPAKVRRWAAENAIEIDGKTISEKGRVPRPFVEAYEKTMSESAEA